MHSFYLTDLWKKNVFGLEKFPYDKVAARYSERLKMDATIYYNIATDDKLGTSFKHHRPESGFNDGGNTRRNHLNHLLPRDLYEQPKSHYSKVAKHNKNYLEFPKIGNFASRRVKTILQIYGHT